MGHEVVAKDAAHRRQRQIHDGPEPTRLIVTRDHGLELRRARSKQMASTNGEQQALAFWRDSANDRAEQLDPLDQPGERAELCKANERANRVHA